MCACARQVLYTDEKNVRVQIAKGILSKDSNQTPVHESAVQFMLLYMDACLGFMFASDESAYLLNRQASPSPLGSGYSRTYGGLVAGDPALG